MNKKQRRLRRLRRSGDRRKGKRHIWNSPEERARLRGLVKKLGMSYTHIQRKRRMLGPDLFYAWVADREWLLEHGYPVKSTKVYHIPGHGRVCSYLLMEKIPGLSKVYACRRLRMWENGDIPVSEVFIPVRPPGRPVSDASDEWKMLRDLVRD